MDKEQHQKDLERIKNFCMMDDDFMTACLDQNIEATELILRIILGRDDIFVADVRKQNVMKNLLGRDVVLDIDASDSNGKEYDIEVQQENSGAIPKRARYHSSIMDAHLLGEGQKFSDLPKSYVIFITKNDVLGGNRPLYLIERMITGMNVPFGDEAHIIYVNGKIKDSKTELGRLMHDFSCKDPDKMYYEVLAKKVRYFKKDKEGVANMCKAMDDVRKEAAKEAKEQSLKDSIQKMMDKLKLTAEQAMDVLEIPKNQRKKYLAML